MPLRDGGFIALGGAADRFLDAPPDLAQHAAHVCGMVLHPELLPDERGDALGCPDLPEEAVRFGALAQQRRELLALGSRQAVRWARWWTLPQRLAAALPRSLQPLAHGAFSNPQRLGDCFPSPALLVEVQRAQPATLAPARRWCHCPGRHACRFTIAAGTLAPYAEVSKEQDTATMADGTASAWQKERGTLAQLFYALQCTDNATPIQESPW